MADPVNVIFHSAVRCNIGPMIYLHWGRSSLVENICAALPRLRTGDVEYASARFIGCCHEKLDGANNLGCSNLFLPEPGPDEDDATIYARILAQIPSDVAKIDVDTWTLDVDGHVTQLPGENAAPKDGLRRSQTQG